jgi:hypothetical protein
VGEKTDREEKVSEKKKSHRTNTKKWGTISKYKNEKKKIMAVIIV